MNDQKYVELSEFLNANVPAFKKQTEITPCLEHANNYIIHLHKELNKKDKWLKEESDLSNDLVNCVTRERAERLSQEKKAETSLMFMIVYMVSSTSVLVYWYLFT